MTRLTSTMVKLVAIAAALYIYPAFAALSPIHGAAPRDTHRRLALARNAEVMTGNLTQGAVSFVKRASNSKFTFFSPGENACGGTSSDGDSIVAMNTPQYAGGAHCFEMITMSYNGKSTQAKIVDECPGCPFNGLDLSPSLFAFLADPDLGVIYGDWEFVGAPPPPPPPKPSPPPPKPSSTSQKPAPTTTSTSSTSTSTTSSSTPSSAPTPVFPPETNNLEALNLLIIQLGGLIAAVAGIVDAEDAIGATT